MTKKDTLLIEVGTEELPPKALQKLAVAFESEVSKRLDAKNLEHDKGAIFATPRRLALKYQNTEIHQNDEVVERRGPALKAAFDTEGKPTKAALGFAKSCGVSIEQVGRLKTEKGEWLAYNAEVKGQSLSNLLPEILSEALNALPIPKRMRWGAGDAEFVRPVHWVMTLLGTSVIDCEVLGIRSGRLTYGHRFHAPKPVTLDSANDYPAALEATASIIVSFDERRKQIVELTNRCAQQNGGVAIIDKSLLNEVTALVEWPVPICGSYDEHFLALPREVLIASMQDHQKYFPLQDEQGKLINKFITIANIDSADQSAISAGNERVIRPRLSDAKFFWDQDLKTRLDEKKSRLGAIVFEKRLGSLLEKTERTTAIANSIAAYCQAEATAVSQAASLSRADLVSEMVGEFPELQGTMAGYYAQKEGLSAEVYLALREFYQPRFAGDDIPESSVGRCVALADRVDTLVGIFAIGAAPTGDKDPYALRRAALGALRILVEGEISLNLTSLLTFAAQQLSAKVDTSNSATQVFEFMMDRLRGYYAEKGYAQSNVTAVLALDPTDPYDIHQRLLAVSKFASMPQATDLASANKRISNILRKADIVSANPVDQSKLLEPAEITLIAALDSLQAKADREFQEKKYAEHLSTLSTLKDSINVFFDEVMVMADDPEIKENRLALLFKIRQQFSQVADISLLSE